MSSYFDALAREVREIADRKPPTSILLEEVKVVEERLYHDVTAITGDREFPDDLRQKAMGILAVHSIYQPRLVPIPAKAVEWILACGYSRAIERMHDLFHEVASRRIETRFGKLSDHPKFDAERRNDHDEEAQS